MPLPLGEWKINSNGLEGTLLITGVSPEGLVSGSLNVVIGADGITGFWDETAHELTFALIPGGFPPEDPNPPTLPIFYKGFLYNTPPAPLPGQDIVWTLAGFFQLVDTSGTILIPGKAHARRNVFGWFAQITAIT